MKKETFIIFEIFLGQISQDGRESITNDSIEPNVCILLSFVLFHFKKMTITTLESQLVEEKNWLQ
jgi:hypothetical protein